MIKKVILGLCVLGSTFLLCGFDDSQSAQSVLQQASEATDSATSVDGGLTFTCDLDIVVGSSSTTTSINLDIGGDYTFEATEDPFAMMVDGSYTFSGFLDGDPEKTTIYAVTNDDGSLGIYTYEENELAENGGTWTYEEDSSVDYNALLNQAGSLDISALTGQGVDFTLSSQAADYNGTECYLLSAEFDASSLDDLLAEAGFSSEEELFSGYTLNDLLTALDGLKLELDYYVDTATYLPVGIHLDLNSSDLSSLNAALQSLVQLFDEDEESSMEIDLHDISSDITLSYNNVSSITVPQEALDGAAASANPETSEELYEQQSSASA